MNIKNICCIGAGYVGGPSMAVIALKCPNINVTVVDKNSEKINSWNGPLNQIPVFEPGLSEIIKKVRNKNLFFSADIKDAIIKSEIIYMAVNTPTKIEGEGAGMAADLKHVVSCALDIAKYSTSDKIIVEKSTLPVRTAEKIKEILRENSSGINFDILSNPEFLAEGTAIEDLFKSDRVLIGSDETKSGKAAAKKLVDIYSNWIPIEKIITTKIWSSELAKLASNAMLAQRISSINSFSALCEKTGADINELSKAIGMDHRIGPHFLKASIGFGGSCFQKDILNIVYLSQYYGLEEVADYWSKVLTINNFQKKRFLHKIIKSINNLKNPKVSVLGWAFKANTNDSRESPAIYIVGELLDQDLKVSVFDPKVSNSQIVNDLLNYFTQKGYDKKTIQNLITNLIISDNLNSTTNMANVIAIITEWDIFKTYDYSNRSDKCEIIDGRFFLDNLKYSQ